MLTLRNALFPEKEPVEVQALADTDLRIVWPTWAPS
jgi:hypothetical protein